MNVVQLFTLMIAALLSVGVAKPSAVPSNKAQFAAYHADIDREFDAMLRYVTTPPNVVRDTTAQAGTSDLETPPAVTQAPVLGTSDLETPPAVTQAPVLKGDQAQEDASLDSALSASLAKNPGMKSALARLDRIRPEIEKILKEEGVPARFAAVVLVESGARPTAQSAKSARGLWQLIPGTARRYGLVVNNHRDDRTDLELSTRAAARYLRDLYEKFGTWRLALAAYNAGEGTVKRALDRADNANFQELSDRKLIPAETRKYVPKVLAMADLLITTNAI